jgi:leucyl aminopeptidase
MFAARMRVRTSTSLPRAKGVVRLAFLHPGKDPAAEVPFDARVGVRAAARTTGFSGRAREVVSSGDWILCGLGAEPASAASLRVALRRALKGPEARRARRLAVCFDERVPDAAVRSVLPHLSLADYSFERYKSKRDARGPTEAVVLASGPRARALAPAIREASAVASAVTWARDLGNTPGNDLGPVELAAAAKAFAKRGGFTVSVLDRAAIVKEKMGGLLGVNAGSARPPVFLIGEYAPKGSRGTVVLVGKGITFDSGGISLKPAASMGEMKYDMMGAATAIACLGAAREIGLPVRLIALTPVTENMPGGSATRPGDILRMRNGKTVEVDNTDAEGRLVLGDALSYSARFKPDAVLDFATLTGAVLIALGHECAGLMATDDALAGEIVTAGEAVGERVWRLPLWDEYRENLKSEWADMRNTAGRNAGTIHAGVFLKEFVPDGVPWAHLDVAGVAHFEKEQSGWPAGASGFGVALVMEFLKRRYANGSSGARARKQ